MVIRGGIRGNGQQLAHYLLSGEANDHIQIVEVAGRLKASDSYLHQTMQGMSLTAELTKSQKGLYHAQINPAYSEDRKMSEKDWLKAADILGTELGLQEQRRVIVLHTKKGRTHAHVVFERYDYQTGKVIEHKFSRLAQDRARKEMERIFEQQPTPHRNQHRPELKEALTALWNETDNGKEFVKAVQENGYMLAEGVPRHPFMVVDENGRSFDLVRQLKGVRIKEVRQRLRHETFIPEKEAIELMRQKQEGGNDANKAELQPDHDKDKAIRKAAAFWDNKQDATVESAETQSQVRRKNLANDFIESGQTLTEDTEKRNGLEKKKRRAGEFFTNADEVTQPNDAQKTIQSDTKPDKQRHQETLKAFIQSEDELLIDDQPTANKSKQQETVTKFFDNQEMTTAEPTNDESEMQKLIQEQKEIRERNRQRTKKRTR
jgi:hypothetical protein